MHAGSRIVNSTIGDRVLIRNHSVITDATIADDAKVGPFAHLRPGAALGASAHVGNFVELKNTTLGPGSKANHLAYLGDATIGAHVNVGAGTITCNYDGVAKHETVIEDGAFIGSNATLVAPVTVGRGAYVAAGSAVTDRCARGGAGDWSRASGEQTWVGRETERPVQRPPALAVGNNERSEFRGEHLCAESSDTSATSLSFPCSSRDCVDSNTAATIRRVLPS